MSYRDDPRYLAAQERYVADNSDDETPDEAFARRAKAAYEMWLVQTGQPVPGATTYQDAMGAYALAAARRTA